jgi:RNA polymerase sigma factor (TIGR02999 family)
MPPGSFHQEKRKRGPKGLKGPWNKMASMPPDDPKPVTALLLAWSAGDLAARDRVVALVYDELRRRAGAYLRRERPGHLLEPTALVNEVYLRLVDQENVEWQNRAQFFGLAAQLMRRILVDHSREQGALKRGGGALPVTFSEEITPARDSLDLAALDDALTALARLDPRQGEIVELRYFGGLSIEETAQVLSISPATVKREWSLARAWLHRELSR